LALDPALASTARANSAAGFGHHGFHRGFEAVALSGSVQSALSLWLASPPHRAILLSPTTRGAIVTVNGVTTLQTR
jgi:uncharacterized protein YkwD